MSSVKTSGRLPLFHRWNHFHNPMNAKGISPSFFFKLSRYFGLYNPPSRSRTNGGALMTSIPINHKVDFRRAREVSDLSFAGASVSGTSDIHGSCFSECDWSSRTSPAILLEKHRAELRAAIEAGYFCPPA